MIRRQHVVPEFFEEAEVLRDAFDERLKDVYKGGINWQYFCDPRMYTYLRAVPTGVFPKPVLDRFMQRLRSWCMENLGLVPMGVPLLHLMVNGCKLGLHSDFHNGVWGYVYSLTRWERKNFSGGETLLLRDGIPSYKRHHVHGEVLYELVPAHFNQLLVFDDRIVHATPTVEGSMDPLEGRIAMVGHIRATSPVVSGSMHWAEARRVILDALLRLRDRIRNYKDVQGTITYRLGVTTTGVVESVAILTDNIVTPFTGYEASDAVSLVKSVVQQTMTALKFPEAAGRSTVIVPVLVPLPDLRPIDFAVPHDGSPAAIHDWAATHIRDVDDLDFQGSWDDQTYVVREPVAGSVRIESREIAFSFDPPMWVPSQRESFQSALTEWAQTASAVAAR
jgi:hypothetical protein